MASTGLGRSRLRPSLPAIVVAVAAAGVVAGCATVPSGNAPRQVLTGASAMQAYPRPLPPPGPGSGRYQTPIQVVLGFLSASASYAFDPAAAKQFLSPALRRTWRPGPVTVVSSPGKEIQQRYISALGNSDPALHYKSVRFTVQHLATLSQDGQYEYSPGTSTYKFTLEQRDGIWLITALPRGGHTLLLTQTSFQEVYQPRNLFFFARHQPPAMNGELVPDPVYAPVQSADNALNTNVAAGLIHGLLSDHLSWLSRATVTAFPPGTKLLKVTISGQQAVVDLGGTAVGASEQQMNEMHAQLLATLASTAYSSPLAQNVVLEINGRVQYPGVNANSVAPVSTGPLVYQSESGSIDEFRPASTRPASTLVPGGETGLAPQVTALAATASGAGSGNGAQSASAVAYAARYGDGCIVYVAGQPGRQPRGYPLATSGGPCTSLSWDRNGNLWAVAGGRVWLVRAQARQTLAVRVPANLPSGGKSGPSILSLKVAPDGVRAALLIKTSGGNQVMLAAVIDHGRKVLLGPAVPAWTSLPGPTALSWYSAYDLVALTSSGIWEVPLTGGAGRQLGAAPAGALSLASDGASLAVGTAQGTVEVSSTAGSYWKKVASGTLPCYPG